MGTLLRRTLLCLAVLWLPACGDATGPDLSDEDFEALLDVLVQLSSVGLELTPGGPAAAPRPLELSTTNVPCPDGGSIRVEGTGSADDETGNLTLDLTLTHQACRASSETGGRQVTIDGAPSLDYDLALFVDPTGFEVQIIQKGTIAWATGGRGGTCVVDLLVGLAANFSSEQVSGIVSGTVCGRNAGGSINP